MNRFLMLIIILLIVPLLHACMATQPVQPAKRSDPLIGKIIRAETGREIDFNTLVNHISAYDVIYLSEKHDNADQHAAQQKIIRTLTDLLAAEEKKPSIGFEFFAMDHTPDLLNFIDTGNANHSQETEQMIERNLRMKLGWYHQSDTMWQYYYDLLKTARDLNLSVAGLDLSTTLKRRITRKGINGITPIEREAVFSTGLSDDIYKTYMTDILKTVHCGMGHEKMHARLYDTWVARNDKMAQSINRMHTHGNGPVIVIVGKGHTAYNLGIIDRLASLNPDINQVNVGLTEIRVSPYPLSHYLAPLDLEGHPEHPKADFLWFFQRVSYADPCEKFKESLKKMKRAPESRRNR